MGEEDIRIALHGDEVVAAEAFAFFFGTEEFAGGGEKFLGASAGEGFFAVDGFVHGGHEAGEGTEPGEPWVVEEKAQEVGGSTDGAEGLLVADAFGGDESFVEAEQAFAKFTQALFCGLVGQLFVHGCNLPQANATRQYWAHILL